MPITTYARSLLARLRARRPARGGRSLRRDPRTDHLRSLRNLLAVRAAGGGWPTLAVGTSYQVLVATSGEARPGERVLVRAQEAIRAGWKEPSSLRFAVGDQVLVVAAEGAASPTTLMEIAQRVRCILRERDRAA